MAEGFEIRGIHEDKMEEMHHEQNASGLTGQLAVITAILATIGAMFSYMTGATQTDSVLLKNSAAIAKTEAANKWNYYQAKSSKQNLNELGLKLSPIENKAYFEAEIKRYETEKNDIKKQAEKFELASKSFDEKSEQKMHQHHRWAQATTAIQVAIATAAIALLTRRKWLEMVVLGMSLIGVVLGVLAYLHI